ncbi:hypothetical protein CQY21_25115 [Mycolicibacterium boenickei]|uniref:Uncharacterized protein n=1 Tax=Mycolicibacterium boenickei TaxID=146017 RepID=A0ABM7J0F5_9MYCO|nr:hypothetical protein CQY21_25115 [Mycolicibacterium boenickei]BBX92608.1 hypothetical protein MBOE_42570 [Mycolicibacterium boenickei]
MGGGRLRRLTKPRQIANLHSPKRCGLIDRIGVRLNQHHLMGVATVRARETVVASAPRATISEPAVERTD